MNILVFDTETDGFWPSKKHPLNYEKQANCVQIAFKLFDENKSNYLTFNSLVKPIFFRFINSEAYNTHHISIKDCEKYGLHPKSILDIFCKTFLISDVIVAHNIDFDVMVLKIMLSKCGATQEVLEKIDSKRKYCTMKKFKEKNFKRCNLNECYKFYFNKDIISAHDALVDVDACADVYFELERVST